MKKALLKMGRMAVVLTLILAMVSGCAAKSKVTTTEPAQGASDETTADTTAGTTDAATLTVEIFDRGATGASDPTDNYWTKWIQENALKDLNMDVKFVSVPRSQEIDQLNVLMAAGTAPDICFTYDAGTIYNYYKNKGIADLTSSLDKYGSDLKAYLGDDVLKVGQYEGQQYFIPAKRIVLGKYATYIRKDWLDALNLPLPETTEEYYQDLKAFKEKNPGNVDNVIPLTATSDVTWRCSTILESFITPNLPEETMYVNATYTSMLPGYIDGVRFLNKLYNEGLLDPQFALYKDDIQGDADTARGIVGSYIHTYDNPLRSSPGIMDQLKANVPTAEFVPIDTFQNSDGKYFKTVYGPTGINIIVPAASKNIDGAVKYLNWLSKQPIRYYLETGEEGVNFDMVDGLPAMKAATGDMIMNSPNNIDYVLVVNGMEMDDPAKNIDVIAKSYPGYEDVFRQAYNLSINDGYTIPTISTPIEAEAQFSNILIDKQKEIFAKAITAKPEDFESVWNAGVKEFLESGAQQIIDERQKVWDANHK
ncbi:MAG: extracellular solute-binding protein [Anaerocolumna sp.]